MPVVNITEYDLNRVRPDKIIIIIGRRGAGKSVLLKHILYVMRHKLHSGVAMSPTSDTLRSLRACLPGSCLYFDYNDAAVARVQEGKQKIQDKIALTNPDPEKADPYHVFIIMDDCMYNKKCMKSLEMRRLFMNGRHVKVFFVNIMQYCMDLTPDLRSNIDYVFAFQDANLDNRFKLWKHFFGMFSKFEEFCQTMDVCTNDNECIVMDNTVKTNKIDERIFYFKASLDLPRFRVGSKSWWLLDYRFGKEKALGAARTIIDKEVQDTYYAENDDKDRIAGSKNKEFRVIKGKSSSIVKKRSLSAKPRVEVKLDGINLDAFGATQDLSEGELLTSKKSEKPDPKLERLRRSMLRR